MSGNQHKFRIGDPVWAKMKGFSPWPGKVILAKLKRLDFLSNVVLGVYASF
jgi:hypothetical protein